MAAARLYLATGNAIKALDFNKGGKRSFGIYIIEEMRAWQNGIAVVHFTYEGGPITKILLIFRNLQVYTIQRIFHQQWDRYKTKI